MNARAGRTAAHVDRAEGACDACGMLPRGRTDAIADAATTARVRVEGGLLCDTPSCRTSNYGHRIECDDAPWIEGLEVWLSRWAAHHAGRGPGQAILCWETDRPAEAPALPAGVSLHRLACMALEAPVRARVAEGVELRPLADHEWSHLHALTAELNGWSAASDLEYVRWYHARRLRQVEAGRASQWGAFLDGALVAGAGLVWDEREARMQEVMTHEGHRRRGIASALVAACARAHLARAPGTPLYVVAAPDHGAQALYRGVGFSERTVTFELAAPAPRSDAELRDLAAAFEAASLPADRFGHREHLSIAALRLREHDLSVERALPRLREDLRRFLVAQGIEPGPDRGYHETITRGWLELIARHLGRRPSESLAKSVLSVTLAFADKRHLLRHWTRECLMSEESRRTWCAPDRAPLEG